MPNSTRSSAGSANSRPRNAPLARIAWRPSRWLLCLLLLLGVLAPLSVLASEMPRPLAWPLAAVAAGWAVRVYRRERRRPPREFVLRGGRSPVRVDGIAVDGFNLQWRGPLAFAAWRDPQGRRRRCVWWPDTLPAARRRELRLAAPDARAARAHASMAP